MVLNLIMFVRLCSTKNDKLNDNRFDVGGQKFVLFSGQNPTKILSIFCLIIRLSCFKTSWQREFSKRSFCSLHL